MRKTPSRIVSLQVAKLLQRERERQGISMTRLAKAAGLSQQMVSYVERGLRNPTLDTLLRITQVLKIDLWRILQSASKR
jgi:transcriptional regulator with XRE-family HTH domain